MDIFQKVRKLNLPAGKYVVHAGSALEGYGIRKSGDVDIAVTRDIYEDLKKKGWKEFPRLGGRNGLKSDIYEISVDFEFGNYFATTEDLVKTATIINGVPFANINEVLKLKKASTRDKDRTDIGLIAEYLKKIK